MDHFLKEKKIRHCLRNEGFILLACIVLEMLLFQTNAIQTRNLSPVELPAERLEAQTEGELIIDEIGLSTRTLKASFSGNSQTIEVSVFISDDSCRNYFQLTDSMLLNPGGQSIYSSAFFQMKSRGICHAIKLVWEGDAKLTGLVVNQPIPWKPLPLRFALLFCLLSLPNLIYTLKLCEILLEPENWRHRAAYLVSAALCICFLFSLYSIMNSGLHESNVKRWETAYPLEFSRETYSNRAHILLADAFLQGKTYIDVEIPEELAKADNPYDPSVREESRWFDYAYYKGRIYVYFGPAPVILYYLPYYFLTHSLPSYFEAHMFFSVLTVISGFWMFWILVRRYLRKIPLALLLLCTPAVVFGTDLLFLLVHSEKYDLNCLCAVFTFFSALGAGLAGADAKGRGKRSGLLFLAALFTFLLVWSRPTAAVGLAGFLIPLFMCILLRKDLGLKDKLIDACSYCLPLAVFMGVVMYYNFIRFDSPFEYKFPNLPDYRFPADWLTSFLGRPRGRLGLGSA